MSALLQNQDQEWQLRAPPAFPPPWAEAWGDDIYGLWADLEVKNVVQRMRWVEPGEFLMGSPESEAERHEREGPQHLVRITQGLWLADTACTQELWQALMGKNPAYFHEQNRGGPQHPVERVSWLEVQEFLNQLGKHLPAATVSLPTEAEWEYACRAGNSTPFSFGEQINPGLANYDGRFPYAGGKRGEYRERSLPGRSFSPNAWGLYQMHGNVWEWCADGRRHYGQEAVTDPGLEQALAPLLNAQEEMGRVLRGGSWRVNAHFARSAYRFADAARFRNGRIGFRLALRFPAGQQASQARQGLGF